MGRWGKGLLLGGVLLLAAVIFAFSAQPAEQSKQSSDRVMEAVVNTVASFSKLDETHKAQIRIQTKKYVRKYAHFFLFLCLGCLCSLFLFITRKKAIWRRWAAALLLCLLYACVDEFHQWFVPGRECQLSDILLDFSGSLLGSGIIFIPGSVMMHRKRKKGET